MSVPIPFPATDVFLLLALPGVWSLARALTDAITCDRGLRAVLPFGLGLCVWLEAIHAASLFAGSLVIGLPVATLLLAVAGAVAAYHRRTGLPPGEGWSPPGAMWISLAVTTALLAPAAFRFWFHDELAFAGHMSTVAQLQNGIYPPRHLGLPEVPFRYHYGFDLFAACLTALLRLQVDRAIDAATLLLWAASWCLLWALGERLSGRAGAWLTPLLVLFAGGVPLACDRPGPSIWHNVLVECGLGRQSINAPVASYFFQHPWGLGIPVAVTAALLLSERRSPAPGARLCAIGLVLTLLSLCEITLFAGLLPAIVVAEAWDEEGLQLRRGARMLGVAVLALGGAFLTGGFFARVPGGVPLQWALHAGFTGDLPSSLVWNAKTFGVLLPLGLVGLVVSRRARVLWGLLAFGSIAVVNGVRFVGTDDIDKFATVASIALGVLASTALARLVTRASWLRTAVGVALAGAATAAGAAFLLGMALDEPSIPSALRRTPEHLSADDIEAMSFVRRHASAGELVHHDVTPRADGWAQWGGLPAPRPTWTDTVFGLPPALLKARTRMLARVSPEAAEYRKYGIAWFVFDAGTSPLAGIADGWIREGTAQELGRFGTLRVVRLSPPSRADFRRFGEESTSSRWRSW